MARPIERPAEEDVVRAEGFSDLPFDAVIIIVILVALIPLRYGSRFDILVPLGIPRRRHRPRGPDVLFPRAPDEPVFMYLIVGSDIAFHIVILAEGIGEIVIKIIMPGGRSFESVEVPVVAIALVLNGPV